MPRADLCLAPMWRRALQRLCRAAGLWLCGLMVATASAQSRLPLTDAERAWVETHPVVHIGVSAEFPPYYFSLDRGRYEGFVIDLMERLAARAGLRVEYRRFERFGDTLAALKAGEIDVTPFTSQSQERSGYLLFVRPLFTTQMVYVADRRIGDLNPDSHFAGYRVAVEKLSTAADLLHEHMPDARIQEYDSAEQAVLAAASGDADVFLGFRQVAVYYMEKHFTANLSVRGTLATEGTALGPAVRKDLPELAGILDKAVADLTLDQIAEVAAKWLPRGVLGGAPQTTASLTPAQQSWVKAHSAFRLGFDASFSPIAFTSLAGGFDGLAADITRAVTGKVGLIAAYQQGGSFADVFDRARRGELDVIVAAARNAERSRDFDFVGPFLSVPTVIVASSDRELDAGLDAPRPQRLALLRQHFLIPLIRSRYPRLALQEYDTQQDVLAEVRRGHADLAIGNMKVVNRLIESQHQGALRVVGTVPQGDSELYFAVRKSLPELAPVLRVALDAVTPAEMAEIDNRWMRVEWSAGVPWTRVLSAAGAALAFASLVIGSLWYCNHRLRLAQRALQSARQLAEEQVSARANFIAYLSHELRGSLGGLASGLEMLGRDGVAPERRGQLLVAMRRSAGGLLALCERTLDFERTAQGGVELEPRFAPLAETLERALAPWVLQAELKGLRLDWHCGFEPGVWVECDTVRLTQILHNLVGNAVKFTSQGAVEVRATLDGAGLGRATLHLTVDDAGPGIEPAQRDRLFVAFAQGASGRRAGRGAGLGLAITARIVEAMRGTVSLAATSASGSRFEVRLPMQCVAAPSARPQPTAEDSTEPVL